MKCIGTKADRVCADRQCIAVRRETDGTVTSNAFDTYACVL